MEVVFNKSIFYFAIFTLIAIACKNPTVSNQVILKEQATNKTESPKSKIDTSQWLKYTSGIRSILEDKQGNFWFGSHQEGVCRFDGEKFTYFTKADGLSDNQVRSIYEDGDGRVWFECGEGLSSCFENQLITHSFKNYFFKNAWQLTATDIWFKGDKGSGYNQLEGAAGVYRFDGKDLIYHTFPIPPIKGEEFAYSVSTPFAKGKNSRVWFGTYSAVIGYDGSDFTIFNNEKLGLNEETGYLHVRSIFEDNKGNLWIGNNGIGVLLYNGKTTINFSKSQGLISENSQNTGGYRSPAGSLEHVFAIGEDKAGNIWFGDRDTGAWRYDGKNMKNFTQKDGLTTTHIWQIFNTKSGELWFAMGDGSICRLNGESFDRIF